MPVHARRTTTHGDTPEHDVNPGCDRDPRLSAPIHLGAGPVPGDPRESFVELLENYPNVIAYVAGHTHEHRLIPFSRRGRARSGGRSTPRRPRTGRSSTA